MPCLLRKRQLDYYLYFKNRSQIGKSMSNESFKSSQNLRKAMEEAQRLTVVSPTPEPSPQHSKYSSMAITLPVDSGSSVLELLRSMSNEEKEEEEENEDHSEKENERKESFIFSLSNKNSNKLLTATSSASATSASTSIPSMHDEAEVKKTSTNIDNGIQETKIPFRSTKKAPSPPLPDQKTPNIASFTTTEVMPSSRNTKLTITK